MSKTNPTPRGETSREPRRNPLDDEKFPFECEECGDGPFYTESALHCHECPGEDHHSYSHHEVDWEQFEEIVLVEIREELAATDDGIIYTSTKQLNCVGPTEAQMAPPSVGTALLKLTNDEYPIEGIEVSLWSDSKRKTYRVETTEAFVSPYVGTKSWFYERYWGDLCSVGELAEEMGVGTATIRRRMDEYGIPRRGSWHSSPWTQAEAAARYRGKRGGRNE